MTEVQEKMAKAIPSQSLLNDPRVKISAASPDQLGDLNIFFDSMTKEETVTITPEMVEAKDKAIELAFDECTKLQQDHRKFGVQITLANDTLYNSLADIYSFALRVQLSEYKQHIINAMTSKLMDHKVKIQSNTTELMIIMKSIIGDDRRRTSEYCRVLEVAIRENLAPKDLVAYIKERGGISAIYSTDSESALKKNNALEREQRLSVLHDFYTIRHWANQSSFESKVKVLNCSDRLDTHRAKFTVFLTIHDEKEQKYRICSALNLGEKQERNLIKFITRGVKEDKDTLIEKFLAYRLKLIEHKLVPDVLANYWTGALFKKDTNSENKVSQPSNTNQGVAAESNQTEIV